MKTDKETLKKNRFWIGLGVFVFLWFVAVIIAKVTGGPGEAKTKYDQALSGIKSQQSAGPKTEAYLKPWNAHGDKFRKHKDVIWAAAWKKQKDMYTWPSSSTAKLQDRLLYISDRFGDTDDNDVSARDEFKSKLYPSQFEGLETTITPAEFLEGINRVVPKQRFENSDNRAPTREECWLAQEDFWVRRELLLALADARDGVSKFKEIELPKDDKLPEGAVKHLRFRNCNWEVDLLLDRDPKNKRWIVRPDSQVKNVDVNKRTLALANPRTNEAIAFQIAESEGRGGSYNILVAGEPVIWGTSRPFGGKPRQVVGVDFSKPVELWQVFDWETSPIRRVDRLEVGAHSHRTMVAGLKHREDLKALDVKTEKGDKGGKDKPAPPSGQQMGTQMGNQMGGSPGGAPGNMMGSSPGGAPNNMGGSPGIPPGNMRGGDPRGQGRDGPGEKTMVLAMDRKRYVHVTPQCRHLPIAMRVVVEEPHIHDVLTAVANSRLRIQITQVQLHQIKSLTRPDPENKPSETTRPGNPVVTLPPDINRPDKPREPLGRMMAGLAGGSSRNSPFFREMTGPRPGDFGPGKPPDSGVLKPSKPTGTPYKDAANLVELSIYGIACLYERFPPKPAAAAPGSPGKGNPAPGTNKK
jgi:hypothetical protein